MTLVTKSESPGRYARIAAVLFLVGLVWCSASIADDEGFQLMTWNVRGYPETSPARQAWFSSVLLQVNADILCVQEIANWQRIHAFLAVERAYSQVAFLDSADGQDNAIFFHTDVAVTDVPDPTGFQHPAELAYFANAGLDAFVLTVHLSWGDLDVRAQEREELVEALSGAVAVDPDVIIAGDFNTTGGYGGTIDDIAETLGLIVVKPDSNVGTTCAGNRYDWILISESILNKWHVSAKVIEFDETSIACKVSDHFPVVATFTPLTEERSESENGKASFEIYGVEAVAECITLRNTGPKEADLGGWTISDGEGSYTFPKGTIVAPGAKHTVCMDTYNQTITPEDSI